jgi:hypothetical protein
MLKEEPLIIFGFLNDYLRKGDTSRGTQGCINWQVIFIGIGETPTDTRGPHVPLTASSSLDLEHSNLERLIF